MAIAGLILVVLASIAMLVFGLQILIRAFKTSVGWGLASLFIPLAVLVFVFRHWAETRRPFLRGLACIPVWAVGGALVILGGAATLTVTPFRRVQALDPPSPPLVETPSLVLKTLSGAPESVSAIDTLPCGDAQIGRTAVTPKEVWMCGRQTDVFGETKTRWIGSVRQTDYFGRPLAGHWAGWLHLVKKEGGQHQGFVTFEVIGAQDGAMSLNCDAGGGSRLSTARGRPDPTGFQEECAEVSSKVGLGRILFHWDSRSPRLRFQSQEGPSLDINLVRLAP